MNDDNSRVVRDSAGRALALMPEPLGSGGQGAVHRVVDSRLAVKLLRRASWRRDDNAAWERRLRAVRRLPIDDLPIARPRETLAPPDVGYVMELLEGVEPIRAVWRIPAGNSADWYRETGGLDRRLRLLIRLARTLATLHGRGIVYGDISPLNVLISRDPAHDRVWLIDPDNLAVESDASRKILGTPGYGAPELRDSASRLSTLSDAFSFAVLTHEVLTTRHPFVGDEAVDGDDPELEDRGLAFELPWVDHSTEDGNRLTYGVPRDDVLTPPLRALFGETFEAGLRAPLERPGMSAWLDALQRAQRAARGCACGHTFYVDRPACPWCGRDAEPVLIARASVQRLAPDFDVPGESYRIFPTRDILVLEKDVTASVQAGFGAVADGGDAERALVTARWDGSRLLRLRNRTRRVMHLRSPNGGHGHVLEGGAERSLNVQDGAPSWRLHLGEELRNTHRLLTFDVMTWGNSEGE